MLLKKRSSPPVFSKSLFLPGCRTQKQRNRLAISLFVCSTQKEPGRTGSSQKPPNSSVHYFILYLGLPQASYSSRFEISLSPKFTQSSEKTSFVLTDLNTPTVCSDLTRGLEKLPHTTIHLHLMPRLSKKPEKQKKLWLLLLLAFPWILNERRGRFVVCVAG